MAFYHFFDTHKMFALLAISNIANGPDIYLLVRIKFEIIYDHLTGVSVKISANFPDGVTPIFSKICNIKYLHDI